MSRYLLQTPAYGIVENGLSHAARPGQEVIDGWAVAMCDSQLMVSVDHIAAGNIPLLARASQPDDSGPWFSDEHVLLAESPDCLRCQRSLTAWEREGAQRMGERQALQEKLQKGLLTQSEARVLAKLDAESGDVPVGMVAVAQPVPLTSWGGHEKGWTVAWGVPA